MLFFFYKQIIFFKIYFILFQVCAEEIKKRDELIIEISRLRNLCAELRTHLEQDTVLLNNLLLKSETIIPRAIKENNVINSSNNLMLKNEENEIQNLKLLNRIESVHNNQSIQLATNENKSVVDVNTLLITKF